MPKLICITGIDGVGKSTLVDLLSSQIDSSTTSNIWDIMEGGVQTVLFQEKRDIDNYLCELSPDSRLLFLAHALKFSIDKAISNDSELVILNGYYYKYFATELVLGASKTLIRSLIDNFPKPDVVIQLDLPFEEIAKRKPYFSRYESALNKVPSQEAFIEFQKKALHSWDMYEKSNWIKLSALDSPEELLKKTLQHI